jgi:hypothetical protein
MGGGEDLAPLEGGTSTTEPTAGEDEVLQALLQEADGLALGGGLATLLTPRQGLLDDGEEEEDQGNSEEEESESEESEEEPQEEGDVLQIFLTFLQQAPRGAPCKVYEDLDPNGDGSLSARDFLQGTAALIREQAPCLPYPNWCSSESRLPASPTLIGAHPRAGSLPPLP